MRKEIEKMEEAIYWLYKNFGHKTFNKEKYIKQILGEERLKEIMEKPKEIKISRQDLLTPLKIFEEQHNIQKTREDTTNA